MPKYDQFLDLRKYLHYYNCFILSFRQNTLLAKAHTYRDYASISCVSLFYKFLRYDLRFPATVFVLYMLRTDTGTLLFILLNYIYLFYVYIILTFFIFVDASSDISFNVSVYLLRIFN